MWRTRSKWCLVLYCLGQVYNFKNYLHLNPIENVAKIQPQVPMGWELVSCPVCFSLCGVWWFLLYASHTGTQVAAIKLVLKIIIEYFLKHYIHCHIVLFSFVILILKYFWVKKGGIFKYSPKFAS